MSGNCAMCTKNITKGRFPGVKCAKCIKIYHIKCADISDDLLSGLKIGSATWVCPDCRTTANITILDVEDDDVLNLQPNTDTPSMDNIVGILKGMQKQFDAFESSFNFICKTLDDLKETISGLSKENDSLKAKLANFELKYNIQESKINFMEAEIDLANQKAIKQNIVVVGLPQNCRDVSNTISKIIMQMGVPMSNDDIMSVQQISPNIKTKTVLRNSHIVTLKTIELKNNILATFRRIKMVQFKVEETSAVHKIIFLHHLTKLQSKLYNEAKNIKIKHQFQFLWCKDSKIYLRKSAESNVYPVLSFNDIIRIQKSLGFAATPTKQQQNVIAQVMDSSVLNSTPFQHQNIHQAGPSRKE